MADLITIAFPLPSPSIAAMLSGSIIADLPQLTVSIHCYPGTGIGTSLPSLTSDIHNLTGETQTIAFNLGLQGLDDNLNTYIYGGVKGIAGILPALTFTGTYTSIPECYILTKLPSLTIVSTSAVVPPDFLIAGILPHLHSSIAVLSENKGSIASIVYPPYGQLYGISGSVGSLGITLPRLTLSFSLLSQGLLTLSLTLPSILLDVYGHCSDTTLVRRAIVINSNIFGVTEYDDLKLAGLTQVFGKTIALNDTSIVSFGSNFDNNSYINAECRTGTLDFSQPYYIKPKDIWIQLHSGYRVRVTVRSDELPDEYTYDSEDFSAIFKKTRVKVGRGLYSSYYDFKVENINGEMIDIKNIHILSELLKERKR